MNTRQRVAVVTGGGGGIGAAIAEELGRGGYFVVTVDPLVSVDGAEQLREPEETTASRIVAAGGLALASSASVTDREDLEHLFRQLADEHGGLDAVVNVAGITRQSHFARGTEEDWLALLSVHLGGYLSVLHAALPLMAAAGYGRVLGITSGSGWREADAGGYSAAKRVVAALTWQLGRATPPGVTVNALSPIAGTRMVAAALERARQEGRASGGGGLTLDTMPQPEDLAPLGAHVVSKGFGWCTGQVLFAGGPEVAVVDQPRLIEVMRTTTVRSLESVLDTVIPSAFAAAEAKQATQGGSNPRFGPVYNTRTISSRTAEPLKTCAVVGDGASLIAAITNALRARSFRCLTVEPRTDFAGAAEALRSAVRLNGQIDAVVVALAGRGGVAGTSDEWQSILSDYEGIEGYLQADASWTRAVSDYAAAHARSVRFVTLIDASSPGGRGRAQASAQVTRVAASSTEQRVTAFTIGMEASEDSTRSAAAQLAAHLVSHPDASAVAGAELAVGAGWIGLRSHPRPIGTVIHGGPDIPEWLDGALREIMGSTFPQLHLEV